MGRRENQDIEQLIEELRVEVYNKVKEDVARWLEHVINELRMNSVDEKVVKGIAKAVAGQEFARLHGIVREELDRFRDEVEGRLSRLGVDPGLVEKIANEVSSKLLNEFDRRIVHLVSVINERSNEVREVLDLVNEILRAGVAFEEEFKRLRAEMRSVLSEEALKEHLYRVLIKHGIISRKRRRWGWVAVGLGILAAIIVYLVVNPIVTLVILITSLILWITAGSILISYSTTSV